MKFKIEAQEYNPGTCIKLPRQISRAMAILSALPLGTLLRTRGLCMKLQVQECHFANFTAHPALNDFKEKENTGCLWGSRETIGHLRKAKNAQKKESTHGAG